MNNYGQLGVEDGLHKSLTKLNLTVDSSANQWCLLPTFMDI